MRSYFSPENMVAGFIAVMVGFTSSAVIVFQAATQAGASSAEISSWLFALGLSIGLSCIGLSLYYRMPILIGWSTPGAVLLATSLTGYSMPEAIGAFIFSALLTIVAGVTGLFAKIMDHIPRALAAAMLAGILLHFGLNVFDNAGEHMPLMLSMLATYLFGKRFFPRYTIFLVLLVGILVAQMNGLFHMDNIHLNLTTPIFTAPVFTLSALISVSIPLFIVTMTSQNLPGIAILNTSGFRLPVSSVISWIGVLTFCFAPFGSYSISLTAMTAAICSSKEADADPTRRYRATVFGGLCWLVIGLLGATMVDIFTAFPKALIVSVAGLALFSTIGSSLKTALEDEAHREPAILTVLMSASGFTLFGIGAAFWGLMAGILASVMLNWHGRGAVGVGEVLR